MVRGTDTLTPAHRHTHTVTGAGRVSGSAKPKGQGTVAVVSHSTAIGPVAVGLSLTLVGLV